MMNKKRMKGLLGTRKLKDGKVRMNMRRRLNQTRLRAICSSTGVAIWIWARGYICKRVKKSGFLLVAEEVEGWGGCEKGA